MLSAPSEQVVTPGEVPKLSNLFGSHSIDQIKFINHEQPQANEININDRFWSSGQFQVMLVCHQFGVPEVLVLTTEVEQLQVFFKLQFNKVSVKHISLFLCVLIWTIKGHVGPIPV